MPKQALYTPKFKGDWDDKLPLMFNDAQHIVRREISRRQGCHCVLEWIDGI